MAARSSWTLGPETLGKVLDGGCDGVSIPVPVIEVTGTGPFAPALLLAVEGVVSESEGGG